MFYSNYLLVGAYMILHVRFRLTFSEKKSIIIDRGELMGKDVETKSKPVEDFGTIEDPGDLVFRDPKKPVKKTVKKDGVKPSEKVQDLDTEDDALEKAKKSLAGKGTRTWQAYEEAARKFLIGKRKEDKKKKKDAGK